MDKTEILEFIKDNSCVEIPALQIKFGVSYREAIEIVNGLVENGDLIYSKGITYIYTKRNTVSPETLRARFDHHKVEKIYEMQDDENNKETSEEDEWAKIQVERRMYFEERRRELIMRMQQEIQEDEDEDNEYADNEESVADNEKDGYENNEELYRQALKFCIERGFASVSLLKRHFPIGYIRACKIIDWMEDNDFISQHSGSKPQRMLIDRNDFENIFGATLDKEEEETNELKSDSALGSYLKRQVNEQDRKITAQNLVNVLSRVAEKKNAPITCDNAPDWSLWNYEDFEEAVIERLERIIKSDRRMGRQGAIKKAETYLEAVRDTHDRKMGQVYERIVYEFKTASDYIYRQLKKQIFNEGE